MDRSSNRSTQTSVFMTNHIHGAEPGAETTDLENQESPALPGGPSGLPLQHTRSGSTPRHHCSEDRLRDSLQLALPSVSPTAGLQFMKRQ